MSLSREFAAFVAGLKFEDLPSAVVDRAKGVTLQALSSALVAHDMPATHQALAIMREEEAGGAGIATALCSGEKFTKAGAAFVNAEMIFAGGKWDTFRMLTHPGIAIMPAALAAAEATGCSGKTFLTAVAAAYEVLERMASEFIPTVMSRGFHAGPVFGIFGAAIAAAKISRSGCQSDQRCDRAMCEFGERQPGRDTKRRAFVARRWRRPQRAAGRGAGKTRHPGRRNDVGRRGRILPFLHRQ